MAVQGARLRTPKHVSCPYNTSAAPTIRRVVADAHLPSRVLLCIAFRQESVPVGPQGRGSCPECRRQGHAPNGCRQTSGISALAQVAPRRPPVLLSRSAAVSCARNVPASASARSVRTSAARSALRASVSSDPSPATYSAARLRSLMERWLGAMTDDSEQIVSDRVNGRSVRDMARERRLHSELTRHAYK